MSVASLGPATDVSEGVRAADVSTMVAVRRPVCRSRFVCAVLVGLVLGSWHTATSQTAGDVAPVAYSTADTRTLLDRVKAGLMRDRDLEAQYTYLEKRRDIKVSKLGRVSLTDERTFEVYPSVEPGRTHKRLVAVNGVPLPAADLRARDASRRHALEEEWRLQQAETPAQRATRLARVQARLARQRREVDEAFESFSYVIEGRERLPGHAQPLLRIRMTPRRDVRSTSNNDFVKYARYFAGHAWVDEDEAQVVRIRLEAIAPVNVGLGLVGRVSRGSVTSYERRKVNDEVWLPWRATVDVTGRIAVFRKFSVETETVWSDYKKFSVQTDVTDVRPR